MARTKNFDREEKLLEAMALFWQQGYADTSIADLVNHLGINRFSLYNAYTDKETLYREALDYYLYKISFPRISQALPESAGLAQLIDYLKDFAQLQREQPCGCFVQNAILERAFRDEDVLKAGGLLYQTLSERFRQALETAQQYQEISPTLDPLVFSHFLVMQIQGIRVLGKARQYEMIDHAMAVLLQVIEAQRVQAP
ncbi:TetR/AcrR family transcriptional regulator [Photobacterium sp. TY1-4]|uniref:TetR/AcrR family transcriptional regulator n=1 Tax=Photobacterium sp. TY1-4 TaxID=2899122 RepID=UPI0021BF463D|nr:TetR/AcrR family transcriptional regulator [Photobacterium sp. TY1-4]UXI03958.1 TetR/AcrR family transcriptional regulator [Photobacterium sp. TY1-4]